MNIAICYLTISISQHQFNLNKLIEQINQCKKHCIDLYIYVNDENLINNYITDNELNNIKYIHFSYSNLRQQFNYNHYWINNISNTKHNSGIQILTLLNLYQTYNNYDYYMFIEDDVLINTNDNIFDNITYNFDILFSEPRTINNNWYWINVSNNIKETFLPYSGLLNIYIVKNEVLNNFINDVINKGLYAHHEYLFNGYAYYIRYNITYLSKLYNVYCKLKLNLNDCHYYDIIHPVKTKEEYNKIILI